MSSFFRHLANVRPMILRITCMPMSVFPGFLSKGINLHASYGTISSGLNSSVANKFLAILVIVFEFATDCCPKCVRIRLHSFTSDSPKDSCVELDIHQ